MADATVPSTRSVPPPVAAAATTRGTTTSGQADGERGGGRGDDDPRPPHRAEPEVHERAVLVGSPRDGGGEHQGGDGHEQREPEGVDEAGAGARWPSIRPCRRSVLGRVRGAEGGADDDADGAEGQQGEHAGPGDLAAEEEPVDRQRWRPASSQSAVAVIGPHQVAEDALEVVVERGHLVEALAVAGRPRRPTGGGGATSRCRRRRPRRPRGARRPRRPAEQPGGQLRGSSLRTRIRCGRSSIRSRMAWKSPSAARRPWAITSTRLPNRSTSSSTWLDTTTHRPSAPRRWKRSMRWRRWRGSRPVSGSSSTMTSGSCDEGLGHLDPLAHALRERGDGPALVGVELDEASAARAAPSGSATPVEHGGEAHELEGGQVLEEVSCWGTRPMGVSSRGRGGGRRRGPAPCPARRA